MSQIEAKDLRVGNLVMYRNFEGGELPAIIDAYDIVQCERNNQGFNLNHSPIALTKELIAANNFSVIEHGEDKRITLNVTILGVYPILFKETEFSGGDVQVIGLEMIHYVHELQNLVWVLFKKELEIKIDLP